MSSTAKSPASTPTSRRTYISSSGSVQQSWTITDVAWGLVNGIALFFQTLISPTAADDYMRRQGGSGGGGYSTGGSVGRNVSGMGPTRGSGGVHQVPISGCSSC